MAPQCAARPYSSRHLCSAPGRPWPLLYTCAVPHLCKVYVLHSPLHLASIWRRSQCSAGAGDRGQGVGSSGGARRLLAGARSATRRLSSAHLCVSQSPRPKVCKGPRTHNSLGALGCLKEDCLAVLQLICGPAVAREPSTRCNCCCKGASQLPAADYSCHRPPGTVQSRPAQSVPRASRRGVQGLVAGNAPVLEPVWPWGWLPGGLGRARMRGWRLPDAALFPVQRDGSGLNSDCRQAGGPLTSCWPNHLVPSWRRQTDSRAQARKHSCKLVQNACLAAVTHTNTALHMHSIPPPARSC